MSASITLIIPLIPERTVPFGECQFHARSNHSDCYAYANFNISSRALIGNSSFMFTPIILKGTVNLIIPKRRVPFDEF